MDFLKHAKPTYVIFTFDRKTREEHKMPDNFDESLINIHYSVIGFYTYLQISVVVLQKSVLFL